MLALPVAHDGVSVLSLAACLSFSGAAPQKDSVPARCIPRLLSLPNLSATPRPSPSLSLSLQLRGGVSCGIRIHLIRGETAWILIQRSPSPASADPPRVSSGNHDQLLQLRPAPFTRSLPNNTTPETFHPLQARAARALYDVYFVVPGINSWLPFHPSPPIAPSLRRQQSLSTTLARQQHHLHQLTPALFGGRITAINHSPPLLMLIV